MKLATWAMTAGLVLGLLLTAEAQVDPKGGNLVTITVTGAGANEDEALRDAMRKAVEQGAGTIISSHSTVKDFTLS
jgi:hypothetical protein